MRRKSVGEVGGGRGWWWERLVERERVMVGHSMEGWPYLTKRIVDINQIGLG